MTGTLAPVRSEATPIDNDCAATALTAAFTVPLDWDLARHHAQTQQGVVLDWYVDPETTARLVDRIVPWCLFDGGQAYLSHELAQCPSPDAVRSPDAYGRSSGSAPRRRDRPE